MSRLEHYMAFMKLPPELQLRINNYYQARYGGKWFHEKDVMGTVSSALKEVQLHSVRLDAHTLPVFIPRMCHLHFFNVLDRGTTLFVAFKAPKNILFRDYFLSVSKHQALMFTSC